MKKTGERSGAVSDIPAPALPVWIKEEQGGCSLDIHVNPRAGKSRLAGEFNGRLKVAVMAPPVDGKANEAIRDFFSETFDIPKSKIMIVRGEKGRDKTVFVALKAFEVLRKCRG